MTKVLNAEHISKLLKQRGGFNCVLQKVKVVSAGDGKCTVEHKVCKDDANHLGSMHGGFTATLVDVVTTLALWTHKSCAEVPSVSVDLHLTYIKGAKVGTEIIIDSKTTKAGKSLAFLTCEIREKDSCDLLAKGDHTKFLLRPKE